MAFVKIGVLLAATCLTAVSAHAVVVKELPGYSQMTVSSQFEAHLAKDSSLVKRLADDADLSRLVMSRAVLQQQLMDKKISIDEIAKQYFPHRYSKDEKEDVRNADDGGFFSQARSMTNRAIAALSGTTARQNAQKEIDKTLDGLADTDSNITIDDIVASLTSVEAVMAYLQKHPEHSTEILSHQTVVDMLIAEGVNKPADHTKPAVDDGGGHGVPQPVIANVNLNARPTDTSLDANGWPKYLNVPANCPARAEGKRYTHAWVAALRNLSPDATQIIPEGNGQKLTLHEGVKGRFHVAPVTQLDAAIQTVYFYRDTLEADFSEYSIPLHTPMASLAAQPDGAEMAGEIPNAAYSISYCPGDYEGVTPAGKPALNNGCKPRAQDNGQKRSIYYRTVAPEMFKAMQAADYNDSGNCVLEENTQYFINIRLSQHAEDWYTEQNSKHAHHEFVPRTMRGSNNPYRAPYTGVCHRQEPYPLNYTSLSCGGDVIPYLRSPFDGGIDDVGDSSVRELQVTRHCYDPYDIIEPLQVVWAHNNDSKSKVYTQGYGKAVSSRYMCENREVQHKRDGQSEVQRYNDTIQMYPVANVGQAFPGVCAAHREGQMREWLCGKVKEYASTEPRQPGYINLQRIQNADNRRRIGLEQCQFNAETQRYDWMLIEHNQSTSARQLLENACVGHVRDIEPNEREVKQCTYLGQAHAIGTRLEGSNGIVWECRRSGVKRHTDIEPLPVFYPVKMNLPQSAMHMGLFPKPASAAEPTVTVVPPAE